MALMSNFLMRALFLESGITWVFELHNIAKSELKLPTI